MGRESVKGVSKGLARNPAGKVKMKTSQKTHTKK